MTAVVAMHHRQVTVFFFAFCTTSIKYDPNIGNVTAARAAVSFTHINK